MLEEAAVEVHWSYKVETDTFCARVTCVANNARCPREEERVHTLFAALVPHQVGEMHKIWPQPLWQAQGLNLLQMHLCSYFR